MTLNSEQVKELEAKAAAYDKMKATHRKYQERRKTWTSLMLAKAAKAGIKVTEAEVDVALKAMGK